MRRTTTGGTIGHTGRVPPRTGSGRFPLRRGARRVGQPIVNTKAARSSGGQRQGTGTDSCDAERAGEKVLPYLRLRFF
jgi:hypothetical protein